VSGESKLAISIATVTAVIAAKSEDMVSSLMLINLIRSGMRCGFYIDQRRWLEGAFRDICAKTMARASSALCSARPVHAGGFRSVQEQPFRLR
jgi:hypothetical protein